MAYTWEEEESQIRNICGCKMNLDESGPFCDRSHRHHDVMDVADKPVGFFRTKEHYDSLKHDDLRDCSIWVKQPKE
jgi:hypothetical protein